jgi:beta-1,4-N-acetylglucosaminyltransferase
MPLCGRLKEATTFIRLTSELKSALLDLALHTHRLGVYYRGCIDLCDCIRTYNSDSTLSVYKMASVFVSVGTTKFDALVQAVDQLSFIQTLKDLGFGSMVIQIGKGEYKPRNQLSGFICEYYDFKSDLASDIERSSLVISHAGAGTILEVLRQKKHLVAVVNTSLMDNHQAELAEALEEQGYLFATTPDQLEQTCIKGKLNELKPYPDSDSKLFPEIADDAMGFIHSA